MDAPAASPLYALVFVVGPEALLPASATAEQLELLQRSGIGSAAALRIFRTPGGWQGSLDDLVADGRADLVQRRERPDELLRYDVLPERLRPVA